jgi:hypothetical protein
VAAPLLVLLLLAGLCLGQESESNSKEQRDAHLARMHELAASIHVFAVPGKKESEVKLLAEPVLRYSDNTRRNNEATLWIWGSAGRPTAIVAIELYPQRPKGPEWLYEIASLSTGLIAVEREASIAWTARKPGLELTTMEGSSPPADKPNRRLVQMKELRGRFSAHEFEGTDGRIELRPLSTPLYRYEHAAGNILDGAIFSFASGTNPEVLLILEAHQAKDSAAWRYGLVQMTGGKAVVQLDDKEVWSRGAADPPVDLESYVNGWIPAEEAVQ